MPAHTGNMLIMNTTTLEARMYKLPNGCISATEAGNYSVGGLANGANLRKSRLQLNAQLG